jgi:hypothetical protein
MCVQGEAMALVGLSEAAKLSGRNQTTIHRAMKAGRLSYSVGEAGERRIDTAELDRVFGVKANGAIADAMAQPVQSHVTPVREIEALQRLLDDREATIRDLRARLDASEEERRKVQGQLTALLADKRESPLAEQPSAQWPHRVLAWLAKQHV